MVRGRVAEASRGLARENCGIPVRRFELLREIVHGVLFNHSERALIKRAVAGSSPPVDLYFSVRCRGLFQNLNPEFNPNSPPQCLRGDSQWVEIFSLAARISLSRSESQSQLRGADWLAVPPPWLKTGGGLLIHPVLFVLTSIQCERLVAQASVSSNLPP
jgi:hypothetical protein